MPKNWLVMEGDGPPAPFRARLAGAGRHLPATVLTTDELMATTRHHTHIDLERLTGIYERRVSIGDEDSYSLATSAALDCLDKAQQQAASLDVVISCSITKFRGGLTQWLEPTMSSAVAHAIGADESSDLRPVQRVCRNADRCHGAQQLDPAGNRRARVGGQRRVHLATRPECGAAHPQHHEQRTRVPDTGRRGSGTSARTCHPGSGGISLAGFTTVADYSRLCLAYPKGHDPGARMFTNSRGIQRAAIADTPLLLHEVLEAAGIAMHDIDHVITHQTSARAIRKGMAAVSASFGDSPQHDAVITVDRYGNTASTTHTVALVEELEAGRIRPGETIALIALASGLEIGVVLLTVDEDLVGRYGHSD